MCRNCTNLLLRSYTQKCQFDRKWNAATLACRGLILDEGGSVVARPFGKFFNFGEPSPIAVPVNEPFVAYDKLDGSLGVLYFWEGKPYIATRGSFVSVQSQEATKILHETYAACIPKLKQGRTYMFGRSTHRLLLRCDSCCRV